MKQKSYKNVNTPAEIELEQLKGTCDILEDKACEIMKEIIMELDKRKKDKKDSKKKISMKEGDAA